MKLEEAGRYMGTVKLGEKGQIVIPKAARDIIGVEPGDTVLVLADKERGIGIINGDLADRIMADILSRHGDWGPKI